MIAVIFEAEPADRDAYFRIAEDLRPLLEEIDAHLDRTLPEFERSGPRAFAFVLARRGGGRALAQSGGAPRGAGRRQGRDTSRLSATGGARDA